MEAGGFDALEVTEAGLREGVFFETLLEGRDPPLFEDVRARSGAQPRRASTTPTSRTPSTSRGSRSRCGTRSADAGLHPGDPSERELLWAAAMLHDIGTAVDYDDHHKHSRYLILNAGLPGFTPRETALIGQMARYHRKGNAGARASSRALARDGDEDAARRAARRCCGSAEQLERSRDQAVARARDVEVDDGRVELRLRRRRGRHGRALGGRAPGATCSSARSGASWGSVHDHGPPDGVAHDEGSADGPAWLDRSRTSSCARG